MQQKKITPPFSWIDMPNFPDAVIVMSTEGIVQQTNYAAEVLLGYTSAEMEGKKYVEFVPPEEMQNVNKFIEKLSSCSSATNFVNGFVRKDETVCYINLSSFLVEKESLIYFTGRDVTELAKVREKQLATEQLLQAVIENSFDLLALIDENGKYLYVSESVYQALNFKADALLGYKAVDLVGTNCFAYMHHDDLPWLKEQFGLLFKGEKKIQVPPYRFKDAQGNWHWLEAIVTNQLTHPNIKAIVVSSRDISQRIETDLRLKEMHLLEALIEGEEKERNRIAIDLHDEVSGMIAAAKMQFSALSEKNKPLAVSKEYEQGMNLLESALRSVRNTSHNLMPELLLENGLDKALQRYCNVVNNEQLYVEYITTGFIQRYSSSFELALYRITQELIGNIIKHAYATEALVQLSDHNNILSLSIEDNGCGFDENLRIKGTGLKSIEKRVNAMNGKMELHSQPGKGTQIYLEFEMQ